MKLFFLSLTTVVFALMTGCSTMNSDFSCKVTAGDSCLTIEQVDAMTRFADDADSQYRPRKTVHEVRHKENPSSLSLAEKNAEPPIWVAPWKDKAGRQRQAATLYAGRPQQNAQG